MITKLLIDRLLKPDHFLRASSQAGPYIGQPVANTNNEGAMRLVSSGNENDQISNLSYTGGQASANGTQTSLVDSKLRIFGDATLVGATITLTSGSSAGESRSVTAFTSALGTVSWTGDVSSTLSGDSYSLSLDYSNRSFAVQLNTGGDTGEAEFIWSHDGGTQYFGRENPVTDSWRAGTTICTDFFAYTYDTQAPTTPYTYPFSMPVLQASNGDLVLPYCRSASGNLLVEISSDNGLTWSTVDTGFANAARSNSGGVVLDSGRILVFSGYYGVEITGATVGYAYHMRSDDNGQSWKKYKSYGGPTFRPDIHRIIELNNGNLLAADTSLNGAAVSVRVSSDGGNYWGDLVQIHTSASNPNVCDIVQMDNGNVLCVYYSQEIDPGTTYSIYTSTSTDNGSTWGGVSSIASGNNNLILPCLTKDVNGDVYCAFVEQVASAGSSIRFMVSPDNGISWGSSRLLSSNENHTLIYPFLNRINGHELVCSYIDDIVGTTAAVFCRVGRSTDSSGTSSIPCAADLVKHRLINDVSIQWYGGDGEEDDSWTFEPEHQYAAENIIADIPKKVWRSTGDDTTCELIIDMGANSSFYMDSIALFDCNINTCSIEMHTADSWAAPSVSTLVDFTVESGVVDSVTNQYITDTSLTTEYSFHEFGDDNHYLIMTSGTSDGTAYKLSDNVGSALVLDTTTAHAISSSDTFNIYLNKMYKILDTEGLYRYMRIYIPQQKTPEGYYQIGTAILGKTTTFNNTFADQNYNRESDYNIELMRSLSGSINPIVHSGRKQKWSVAWTSSEVSRKQAQAAITYGKGNNIAFIPDWFVPSGGSKSSTTDVYLVKQVGTIRESFRYKNRWDMSVDFEENI